MSWFQSASDRSPPAFFVAFDIYVKQHGHQRYMQAIEQSNLDKHTKLDLLQKISYWKVNDGIQFWLDRQSQSSQIRTASTLVKGSESYAEDSIHRTRKMKFGDVEGTEVEDTHFPNPVFEPETRFSTQKENEIESNLAYFDFDSNK
ncbi:hypothetical protein BGZ88_002146 [Linnemannia elongata]|nr:hypothetical protein BGZ88_002146 [Linnemannia elongata]